MLKRVLLVFLLGFGLFGGSAFAQTSCDQVVYNLAGAESELKAAEIYGESAAYDLQRAYELVGTANEYMASIYLDWAWNVMGWAYYHHENASMDVYAAESSIVQNPDCGFSESTSAYLEEWLNAQADLIYAMYLEIEFFPN
jgi:hypothetical protein